ncbi:MAG: ABC transporter ATP-binding protein [Bacteroidales bacterium]|nr:ABC transporter ATP-binding protein [Bacteroidales bacterium]
MGESQRHSVIEISDVSIGYQGKHNTTTAVCEHLSVTVSQGELVCLLGPNGCGKSTFIRTIAGMQPALQGSISLDGRLITTMRPDDLAKKMSVVLTDRIDDVNMSVYDIVSLGRYPYTNWYGKMTDNDEHVIIDAMRKVSVEMLAERRFQELSDGEKQRTMIAKALAQDTSCIVLDEPTAHLDLPNRIEVMELLKVLAHSTQKSILVSTHELSLALQVADNIWLMQKNGPMLYGAPQELVRNKSFEQAFKLDSTVLERFLMNLV